MQKEKIAVIGLIIIIVGALSVFILLQPNEDGTGTILDDILVNLFGDDKVSKGSIELGDCADVNYIGKFVNGTVFESTYSDVENKTDGAPLNIFVSLDITETPPEGYEEYYPGMMIHGLGFTEGLVGLKEGETSTIGPIPPEKAYGLKPKVGDIIDLTSLAPDLDITYTLKIIEVQEDVPMPSNFELNYGTGTTTLYTLRQDWHYIGEIIDTVYTFWDNSSVVTKINETLLWMYTTPSTEVNENFTWIIDDLTTGLQTTYPENASSVTSINDTTIIVTHSPAVNTTIDEVMASQYGMIPVGSYTIENVTADKINTSITDSTGNKTYKEFGRTTTIQRNETQNITELPYPGELLEEQLFSILRAIDSDFELSYSTLAGETLYFEVTIEKVYKTSQKES